MIQSQHTIPPVPTIVDDIELVSLDMGESLCVLAGFGFLLECLVRHILERLADGPDGAEQATAE